ncbi:glucose-6-phosphatase [Galendromus occidentalis]|uniref:Glucose-6-phosphatase n=1 Tax=Galendromus occidentalis TaxID=34638 RepID=A0AAJ6QXE3_9ACAR|nr:glucose-6-phosphatase [Galendromus occidentalis]
MEFLYEHGITALQVLQKHGEPYCDLFQDISSFCDPAYAFFVYPPLFYALCQNSGRAMLLVVIITEWANMVLKWILLGHRPYWWVMENMTPAHPGDTIIKQFPLTCETGPGSPSGHAQLQTALNYAIVHFLTTKVFARKHRWISRFVLIPAFIAVVVGVSLSRLYIAAHFPHQCMLGVAIGFAIASSLVGLDTSRWSLKKYLFLTLFLFVSTMATKRILETVGVDVLSTIGRAQKHCARPEWIHVNTTPYFSMTRFLGFCAGVGLATHCGVFSIAGKEISTGSRVVMGVAAAIIGKLSENIDVPFKDASPLFFYIVAFSYYVAAAYMLFAVVPSLVLKVIGGEVKDKKKL